MYILGVETSCDETSCAVINDKLEVLSNVVISQVDEHKLYGGVVPEVASRMHIQNIDYVCNKALKEAKLEIKDIDLIGATFAPGLIGAVLVGLNFAKGLSFCTNIPFVSVHHLRAHIASNYLTDKNLKPPFIALVVSGGHTQIIKVNDYTDFEIISTTVDDAVGECYDKVARSLGLSYPGGIEIDKLSKSGNDSVYNFPKPSTDNKFNFSFSGLKTASLNLINNSIQKGEKINIEDFSASFQKNIVDILVEKSLLVLKHTGLKTLCVSGGVSANSLLRKKLEEMCESNNFSLNLCDLKYCGDNAAMVAAQAYFEFKAGNIAEYSLNAVSNKSIV